MRHPGGVTDAFARRDRRGLARLLSWLEADDPRAKVLTAPPRDGHGAVVIGLTGPPGAGKSTLASALVSELRRRGDRVAVLAVDPSSPYSGGALLGDRIRMVEHLHDEGVFIRSMATRGQLGGLSSAVPDAVEAMDQFGFEWIIVETVGTGQTEVDIRDLADTTAVVFAPGWGDDIQASKAGLIEIADVLVVNKADLPGADRAAAELDASVRLSTTTGWRRPVVRCTAVGAVGVAPVVEAIKRHLAFIEANGELIKRRQARRVLEYRTHVRRLALRRADALCDDPSDVSLREDLKMGRVDPRDAARRTVVRAMGGETGAPSQCSPRIATGGPESAAGRGRT